MPDQWGYYAVALVGAAIFFSFYPFGDHREKP